MAQTSQDKGMAWTLVEQGRIVGYENKDYGTSGN